MPTRRYPGMNVELRPTPKVAAKLEFPFFLFLLTLVALTGAFHFILVDCPMHVFTQRQGGGSGAVVYMALEGLLVWIGSQPILAAAFFLAVLAPGLLNFEKARSYFLCVTFGCLVVAGLSVVFVLETPSQLGQTIHGMLSADSPVSGLPASQR